MTVSLTRRLISSVAAAVAVALAAHVVVVLAFYLSQQFTFGMLTAASDFFALPTVLAFILVFLVFLIGQARSRLIVFLGSVLAGILSVILSTLVTALGSGSSLTLELLSKTFGALTTIPLVFWIAVAISAVTLGVAVYRPLAARGAVPPPTVGFVRIPSPQFADGDERSPIDEQWDSLVGALSQADVLVDEVAGADDDVSGTFIGDRVRAVGELTLLFADAAGDEGLREHLAGERVATVTVPDEVALAAADIVVAGHTVYVASGEDAAGVRWLRALLADTGHSVVAVTGALLAPLASLVAPLPDGTVLTSPAFGGDAGVFTRSVAVPENTGAHSVAVSDTVVVVPASAPQTAELVRACGYTVIAPDLSAFADRGVLPGSLVALV